MLLNFTVKAQNPVKIKLKNVKTFKEQIEKRNTNGFQLNFSIPELQVNTAKSSNGDFLNIYSEYLIKTFNTGYPELPVMSKLIEVPVGADVNIKVLSYNEEVISLEEYDLKNLIVPAQPSPTKSNPNEQKKFHYHKETYSTDAFYANKIARYENSGIMRNVQLGRIEISPLQYNPVTNQLKVINNIKVQVTYQNTAKSNSLDKYASPFFNGLISQMTGEKQTKALVTSTPVKYVIVSDRMFKETLQPFIAWKKKKGFHVVEAYTDVIGTTKQQIRDYLKNLYENPAEGENAPDFVLFVGDVNEIPSFGGSETCDEHVSDLYYCEYTDDYLPEVFYGRFSASSVAELEPQINKTLEYEQYLMPDPAYLDETLLIAGVDNNWAPINGNGALNYISDNYINAENGLTSYNYFYKTDDGIMSSDDPDAAGSIIEKISNGIGFGNYTAHCNPDGWGDPAFQRNDIDGLQNAHEYPLLIGNCCLSSKFDLDDCFGEKILQANEKGAIGYIGASNSSLWNEDYWWGVGVTNSVVLNPTYEISGQGAYDRLFHTNGEETSEWYITQGQIFVAGNLAVEASTSTEKRYYWEIYHLMGDPSLMNYIGVPDEITYTTSPSAIYTGSNSFEITTAPYAYVALSKNGELLATAHSNASGLATLSFDYLKETDALDLVISAQNKQPLITTINVEYATEPALVVNQFIVDDVNNQADCGETINIDLSLKNVTETGTANDLSNIVVTATCNDAYVTMSEQTVNFTEILAGASELADNALSLTLSDYLTDQHKASINLAITAEHNENPLSWNLQHELVLNAPSIQIGAITIDDASSSNPNENLDPGESANLNIIVKNNGHSDLTNASLNFEDASGTITATGLPINAGTISAQQEVIVSVPVLALAEVDPGTMINVLISVEGGSNNSYSVENEKIIIVGETPHVIMGEASEYSSCNALFLDSGGEFNNYNNNENNSITLKPAEAGNFVSLDFIEFDIESSEHGCYDEMYIYDGPDASSELIGTFCNIYKPQLVTAQNPTGALTVVFESDSDITKGGWKAQMACESANLVNFMVTENCAEQCSAFEGAVITINNFDISTSASGQAGFTLKNGTYSYSVTATGYVTKTGQFTITDENKTIEVAMEKASYNITFNIINDLNESLDAEITLNGTTKTATNGTVVFENLEYKENASYAIEMFCYETINDVLNIDATQTINIDMDRVKTEVELHIYHNGEVLSGAIVKAGIYQTVANSEGVANLTLPANTYELSINKSGYSEYNGTLVVEETPLVQDIYMNLTDIENENVSGINVYPNPAKDILYIRTNDITGEVEISITGIDGRMVFKESRQIESLNKIDLLNLKSGMYILNLKSKEQNFRTNIIIQ